MRRARENAFPARELDRLRLVAVGRIPRCARCPRFAALVDGQRSGGRIDASALPSVPAFCTHEVCAPLAARMALRRAG